MSRLLALLASAAGSGPGAGTPTYPGPAAPVADPEATSVPYAMPTTRPYNVPQPCVTPTYDGSGHALHPSVVDFGPGQSWNGWRYWMAMTPFSGGDEDLENPSILASDDGFTWQVPPGLTNPLAVRGAAPGFDYNSDAELIYHDGKLWCFWRPANGFVDPLDEALYYRTSTDGVTWTPQQQAGAWYDVPVSYASPSIVRLTDTSWRCFTNAGVMSATSPGGPWSTLAPYVHGGLAGRYWWHHSVVWTGSRFWALINNAGDRMWAATSRDGVHWTHGPQLLALSSAANDWEDSGYYRPHMVAHPDGTKMRVWYSGNSTNAALDRHIGYTHIPNGEWASLSGEGDRSSNV